MWPLQALEKAKSLEEVTNSHARFVEAVQRQCLLAPDKTWKLIETVVIQILDQALRFADLQQKLQRPVGQACARQFAGLSTMLRDSVSMTAHACKP